jgi:hypothetical protein
MQEREMSAAQLTAILELTEQVQSAIDAGDWQRALALETERHSALELLARSRPVIGQVEEGLRELYVRNQRMIGEVRHHQRRVVRDATTVRTGHAAAAAYRATSATSANE